MIQINLQNGRRLTQRVVTEPSPERRLSKEIYRSNIAILSFKLYKYCIYLKIYSGPLKKPVSPPGVKCCSQKF